MKVLVGGGSGFVGTSLAQSLRNKGHSVTIISRNPGKDRITWSQIEREGLPQCDAIIQIPGANVLEKRWTEQRKKTILESREGLTSILVKELLKGKVQPKVFVSGSAIGYYPPSLTEEYTEDYAGPPAQNFAGELCSRWEAASQPLEALPIRRSIVRLGVVLGAGGGAMSQLLLPFRLGLGGPQGSGRQWWPWIHVHDAAELLAFPLSQKVDGIFNGVAPESVTNATMATTLGKVLHRPAVIPLPSPVVRLLFGESSYMLLEGQKVIPQRTEAMGFRFQFPTLESALKEIVSH